MRRAPDCPFLARLGVALVLIAASAAGAEDRSFDGSGNNLDHPSWGRAGTRLGRAAAPAYADGVAAPAGASRPNPREVSNLVIAQDTELPSARQLSGFVFQWGQFLDHDLDLTPLADPAEPLDIAIPAGDSVFDPAGTGTATMPFLRSMYDPSTGSEPANPRQQINVITSYIDASNVYGSDAARARALRAGFGGRLATSAGDLLPYNTAGLPNGTGGAPDPEAFFVAGDERANEQIGLTALHTLFVREHNRLADALGLANPDWTDEEIYQRARKIVGAEVQAITYGEFLPALLGAAARDALGSWTHYQPDVDPSILVEFSTAFYRVGHTMLMPALPRVRDDGSDAPGGPLPLRDAFFVPDNLNTLAALHGTSGSEELELLLRGLASRPQQEVDVHVVDDVRNFLFGEPLVGGFDLAALNLQRGRDHGLPDYNGLRVAFGLPAADAFGEISSDPVVVAGLAALYASVDELDPWLGGLAEDPLPGSSVGPLVAAALGEQFRRLRDGDRFWYENDPALADLVDTLRATRLSDVIRRNTGITRIQRNVFLVPEAGATDGVAAALAALAALGARRRWEAGARSADGAGGVPQ